MKGRDLQYVRYLLTVFEMLLFMLAGGGVFCGTWKGYVAFAVFSLLGGWCDEMRKRLLRLQWEQERVEEEE